MLLTVYYGVVVVRRLVVSVVLCIETDRVKKSNFYVMSLRTFCFSDLIIVPALIITSTVFYLSIDNCKREFGHRNDDFQTVKLNLLITIVYGYLTMPCLAVFLCHMTKLRKKKTVDPRLRLSQYSQNSLLQTIFMTREEIEL